MLNIWCIPALTIVPITASVTSKPESASVSHFMVVLIVPCLYAQILVGIHLIELMLEVIAQIQMTLKTHPTKPLWTLHTVFVDLDLQEMTAHWMRIILLETHGIFCLGQQLQQL